MAKDRINIFIDADLKRQLQARLILENKNITSFFVEQAEIYIQKSGKLKIYKSKDQKTKQSFNKSKKG